MYITKKMNVSSLEAIIVWIIMMVVGLPSGIVASKILPVVNNHIPIMYLSLFLTALSSHLIFEFLRVNGIVNMAHVKFKF